MNGTSPDSLAYSMVINSISGILVTLICIILAWYGVQQIRLDLFLKQPKSAPAKILQIFLAIALGYQVARFFLDYFSWSVGWSGLLNMLH